MNPEHLLALAEKAITDRNKTMCGPWRLCYLEYNIQCIATADLRTPEIVFAKLSAEDVIRGMTSKQWNKISNKITDFWRQKKL